MKTRIISKTLGLASMISAGISAVIAAMVNEVRALVDLQVMEPRRVKVPVRVQHGEFSDRSNFHEVF